MHAPGAGAKSRPTVKLAQSSLGKILVSGSGRTLYAFTRDGRNTDRCMSISGCTSVWPILTSAKKPTVGPGVKASLLSSIKLPHRSGPAGHLRRAPALHLHRRLDRRRDRLRRHPAVRRNVARTERRGQDQAVAAQPAGRPLPPGGDPAGERLRSPHRLSRWRSSIRRIFPVSVFGRSGTNSISRGYA